MTKMASQTKTNLLAKYCIKPSLRVLNLNQIVVQSGIIFWSL